VVAIEKEIARQEEKEIAKKKEEEEYQKLIDIKAAMVCITNNGEIFERKFILYVSLHLNVAVVIMDHTYHGLNIFL